MYVLRYTAVRLSSATVSPPLARTLLSLSSTLFFFILLLYVARFNDTKVTYNSIRTLSQFSFLRSPFTPSHSLFFSLSNTGRVLSDKNSSLNKHTIQKLLSYRLTASVKRVVLFYHYFFSSLSLCLSLPALLSL